MANIAGCEQAACKHSIRDRDTPRRKRRHSVCQGGGRTMANARSASLNGGLGAEPPAGSRGRALGGRSGGLAESFMYIFIQKVARS